MSDAPEDDGRMRVILRPGQPQSVGLQIQLASLEFDHIIGLTLEGAENLAAQLMHAVSTVRGPS